MAEVDDECVRTLLAVEKPGIGVRVIRAAGVLDQSGAAHVLRLVDAQHYTLDGHSAGISHVVIDLADIREFHADGLDILARARDIAHAEGCTLHLTGCGARIMLLPIRVRQGLSQFDTYPTLDAALTALGCA